MTAPTPAPTTDRLDSQLDRHFHLPHPHYSPGLRLTLGAVAVSAVTAVITTLVTLAATDDPTTVPPLRSYAAPSTSGDSPAPSGPPGPPSLTLRALIPAPQARAFTRAPLGRITTTTASLYLATPGLPVPDVPIDQLAPAGQAALTCTRISETALQMMCTGSAYTPYGQLTFAGASLENDALADPPAHDITLSVVGGTDRYQHASGTLSIDAVSPTEQDWAFEVTQ